MSQSFGPKLNNKNLVLCLDSFSAMSYKGNPITNLAYNRSILGMGSTWEAITSVPSSDSQTDNGRFINFPKLNTQSNANSFTSANGKIFRNYVNNPALSDDAAYNNNAGFRYASAIDLLSGSDDGYVIISFWCYLVTGYTGYTSDGLSQTYMSFGDSGGSTLGNPTPSIFVDGVSKTANETFNDDTGRWKFVQLRFTKIANTAKINSFYIYSDRATQGEMYVAQLQIEDRVDSTFHQIPYVENTLSATNAWTDLSGNGNHGTFINTSGSIDNHFITGKSVWTPRNSGINFSSDGTSYVNINHDDSLNTTGDITIETWVYLGSSENGSFGIIVSKRDSSDYTSPFTMWFEDRLGENSYRFVLGGGNTDYTLVGDNDNFNGIYNKWDHVVGVVDDFTVTIYVNGVASGNASFSGTRQTNSRPIRLGNSYTYSVLNHPLIGKIGMFRMYKRALSSKEILGNYRTVKGRYGL